MCHQAVTADLQNRRGKWQTKLKETTSMYMQSVAGLMIVLTLLFSGCSTFDPPGVVPPHAQAMSATELGGLIEAVINDQRIFDDGYDQGLSFSFQHEGKLIVTSRYMTQKNVVGRWRIDRFSGRLCTRIEADGETCAPVYRLFTIPERYYLDIEGGSQRANTFVMRQ
jgi:acyl-CoA synthetase (AMP-forming)/AMP-acid ligase II